MIYLLSGDPSLNPKGEKTQIPYLEWHNYYRSRLLTRDAWSRSVFTFFNNALFKATSTEDDGIAQAEVEEDDWELAYQNAFKAGVNVPTVNSTWLVSVLRSSGCPY